LSNLWCINQKVFQKAEEGLDTKKSKTPQGGRKKQLDILWREKTVAEQTVAEQTS
jgi:hypothetical protein